MANKKVQIDILADTKNFHKGMSDAEKDASKLHSSLNKFGPLGQAVSSVIDKLGISSLVAGASMAGAGAALGAGLAIVESAIGKYVALADGVRKYALVTGQSADASSRQIEAFDVLGVNAETAAGAMFRLGREVENTPAKLTKLGIEIAHSKDGTVDLNATLLNVIDAYQQAGDAAQKDAIVFAAFGKAGATMIPILETNSAQLKRLEEQAKKVFSDDDLNQVRDYQIASKELKESEDALGMSLGRTFLPAQLAAVEATNRAVYVQTELGKVTEQNSQANMASGHAAGHLAQKLSEEYDAALKARKGIDALAQAQRDAAQAALDEEKAEQGLSDAVHKDIAASFQAEQAQLDLNKAVADYNAKGGKTTENALRLREAFVKLADATVAQAEAQAEANGVTLSASQKNQIWIAELQSLTNSVDPKSPLRKYLQSYIDELKSIPGSVTTDIHANIAGKPSKHGAVQHFAEGGIVGGSPDDHPVMASRGEGVFTPEQMAALGQRSGGGDVHLHIDRGAYIDGPSLDYLTNQIARRLKMATGI